MRALALGLLLAAAGFTGCIGPDQEGGSTEGRGTPLPGLDTGSQDDPETASENSSDENASPTGGFSRTHVFPGNYTTSGEHSQTLEAGPYEVKPPKLVRLESPVDGVPIAIEIHQPNVSDAMPVPVIAYPSPFFEDPGIASFHEDDATPLTTNGTYAQTGQHNGALVDNLAPHGYAVALIAERGTADSGGCSDPLGPKTLQDYDHAITWLADQDWSTGSVGVVGIFSASGASAWTAAATGNPHVETVVPAASWPDHYGRLFHNGTPMAWGAAYAAFPLTASVEGDTDLKTRASRVACQETIENVASTLHAFTEGGQAPTGFWEQRDRREDILSGFDGSVLLVHGLQDTGVAPHNVYPFADRLEVAGIPVKHLLGQWGHQRPDDPSSGEHVRWDFMETLLHWMDYWVGGDTSRDLGPRVQVEDTGGAWRSGASWPPADANETTFYLHPDGRLARSPTAQTGDALLLPAPTNTLKPGHAECEQCASFSTEPLEEPLRFAGVPQPTIEVTPTSPRGYLTVYLLAEAPDGTLEHLSGGQMDLRFADGDRTPEPLTPGEPVVAQMALEPQDAIVPEGSRLAVHVSQNTYGDNLPTHERLPDASGPLLVELGDGQSSVTLETFDIDEEAFFRPPGVDG